MWEPGGFPQVLRHAPACTSLVLPLSRLSVALAGLAGLGVVWRASILRVREREWGVSAEIILLSFFKVLIKF